MELTSTKTKYKEMDYNGSGKSELLYHQEFSDGTALAVINCRGSHPCGYIKFPGVEFIHTYDDFEIEWDNDPENIDDWDYIPGGFTFLGGLKHHGLEGTWIGWDYAHLGDWTQCGPPETDPFSHDEEEKHTTREIIKLARKALRCIREGKVFKKEDLEP